MQFEILKNPGIDFYSGFRKTSQGGGGANLIPKKVGPPYPQILDPPPSGARLSDSDNTANVSHVKAWEIQIKDSVT